MPDIALDGLEFCCTVKPDSSMVDYNRHVSAVYFVPLFERAGEAMFARLGIGTAHRQRKGRALSLAEAHIAYSREVFETDEVDIYCRVLDANETAVHVAYAMINRNLDALAATQEALYWHRMLADRQIVPMEAESVARLARLKADHDRWPLRLELGRRIGIRRRSPV